MKYRTERLGSALTARAASIANVARARGIELRYERAGALGTHVMKLDRARPVAEVAAIARAIAASDPEVEYAEPDIIMQPMFTPNDPSYSQQWHYFETTGGIRAPAAWDLSTGSGVRVAVLDTGYLPHVDLSANILPGYDFVTDIPTANDGGGRDGDASDPGDWTGVDQCYAGWPGANSSWHGTHVAGTIAASTNNSTGVAGVAFNSQIVPVRVLGTCGGTISDIADAIVWAAGGSVSGVPANPYPARVLNLSLGAAVSCGPTYQNAINAARALNSVVVVAAGNSSADATYFSPAGCTGIVTVAATNRAGGKASYSNYGSVVDIAAPGGETGSVASNGVLSTLNSGTTSPYSDNYVFYQGTSMAAPHVAGVAALMLSANGALTPDNVLSMLQSSARAFPGTCSQCGSGILNADNAVRTVLGLPLTGVDNITMTIGGAGPAWGYSQGGFGSVSPSTTSDGKTYRSMYAWYNYWNGTRGTDLWVCGFSSNPGATWLSSWSSNGYTLLATAAAYNFYPTGLYPNCAAWSWNGNLNFNTQHTVVHQ